MESGNPAVLKNSHTAGVLPVNTGEGVGGLESILDGVDDDWVHFNYQVGDVLMFTSLTGQYYWNELSLNAIKDTWLGEHPETVVR